MLPSTGLPPGLCSLLSPLATTQPQDTGLIRCHAQWAFLGIIPLALVRGAHAWLSAIWSGEGRNIELGLFSHAPRSHLGTCFRKSWENWGWPQSF